MFGSVLREDFSQDSDIDVLVEFEEGHTPGLKFFAMERELSELLGRSVDLNTPGFLSHQRGLHYPRAGFHRCGRKHDIFRPA